jgi:hypothetical protein
MILYGSTTASPARLSFAKGKADRIPVYGGTPDESRESASFTTKILCALLFLTYPQDVIWMDKRLL